MAVGLIAAEFSSGNDQKPLWSVHYYRAKKPMSSNARRNSKNQTVNLDLERWFDAQGWFVQAFQREVWGHMAAGRSGLLNAPTGTGKTYAVWGGVVNAALLNVTPASSRRRVKGNGATPGQARSDSLKRSGESRQLHDGIGGVPMHTDSTFH